MAPRFSDETKRSIWIVVAAGIVIAFVSGTWGMLQSILGDDEDAPSPTDSALAVPAGPVPEEVDGWFADDLGTLERPYPQGVATPTVEELLPQVKGSTFVSGDDKMITIEYPTNYVDPAGDAEESTYGVYRRGDLAVLEALRWRCDWAQSFVEAEAAEDDSAISVAREQLESFSGLSAVEGLPVAKQNAVELEPVLGGSVESGRQWLAEKCGR